jgi:hypothetical protein
MKPYAQKSGVISQVSSKHEPPEPCTSRKPTPDQALELKIKLPWEGKVQHVDIDTLTKDLFVKLENYGLARGEIAALFNTHRMKLVSLLLKWGVPKGKPCVQNKTARDANTEKSAPVGKKPMDLSRTYHDTAAGKAKAARLATKPGQTQQQAVAAAAPPEDADGLNYQDRHNLGIHTPTEAEKEDVFRPEDDLPIPFIPSLTLRDCAEKLVAAIDAREAADKQINYYTAEIRRLA